MPITNISEIKNEKLPKTVPIKENMDIFVPNTEKRRGRSAGSVCINLNVSTNICPMDPNGFLYD